MTEYENEIIKKAIPLRGEESLESLINGLRDKKIVMLGESSHGTEEYYRWRQLVSQELISKHGFRYIAVEGEWPDCQKINRFISNKDASDGHRLLASFDRWPTWMLANFEFLSFMEWAKAWNEKATSKVSFFGLDIYSFYESIDRVIEILKLIDPELAIFAQEKYACLDDYRHDERSYVKSLFHSPLGCKREALDVLDAILKKNSQFHQEESLWFDLLQNATIVASAENYYRSMVFDEEDSWNVREEHMISTLGMLLDHFGADAKIIVWAHNTHVGDYRATDMVASKHFSIGGLAREIYGAENVGLVGLGSFEGSVIASYMWNGPVVAYDVPEARPGSIDHTCHHVVSNVGHENFYINIDPRDHDSVLNTIVGHRAIGVVYDPDLEHRGNFVPTAIGSRYDSFIYFDRTNALTPFETHIDRRKFPETYPFGNRM
jgi:erythromycin esterase